MRFPAAGHREIDHTADLGFEVWAASLEELFGEATRALAELCYERVAVAETERRPLAVSGANLEERLVRWLHEIYLNVEGELWLTATAEAIECSGDGVTGYLWGEPYDPERHTLHTEIKAITYHGMRIERAGDGLWRTLVVVDV